MCNFFNVGDGCPDEWVSPDTPFLTFPRWSEEMHVPLLLEGLCPICEGALVLHEHPYAKEYALKHWRPMEWRFGVCSVIGHGCWRIEFDGNHGVIYAITSSCHNGFTTTEAQRLAG